MPSCIVCNSLNQRKICISTLRNTFFLLVLCYPSNKSVGTVTGMRISATKVICVRVTPGHFCDITRVMITEDRILRSQTKVSESTKSHSQLDPYSYHPSSTSSLLLPINTIRNGQGEVICIVRDTEETCT